MKKVVSGLGVSGGEARGNVRVVSGPSDASRFQEGEILVTRMTDPTMVVMMSKAGAIVCDIGGMTSHPSIVSRELGIPCVVNCKKATLLLKDGKNVLVDGKKGAVYAID